MASGLASLNKIKSWVNTIEMLNFGGSFTYEMGVLGSDVLLHNVLSGALVHSTVALLTNQAHLCLEDRLVAAVRVCHADALSKDVLLHNSFSLWVLQSLAHILRVVLTTGQLADHPL